MTSSSDSSRREQAMTPEQELARALKRELQKNKREVANAADSSRTSASMNMPTPLLKLLEQCCSLYPQRNEGSFPSSTTSRALSPARSASSESSVSRRLNSTTAERSNCKTAGLNRSAVVPQSTPNSIMPPSAPNAERGRRESPPSSTVARVGGLAPASTTIPRVTRRSSVKVPKKRKRKSKKPPTKIIKATAREFRATVQELTGYKGFPVPVLRPQHQPSQPQGQPQAYAVPIDVNMDSSDEPSQTELSLTSMTSPVHSSAPTVTSDRAPAATFANYDSSTSVPCLSLNHCMGYDEEATPCFLSVQADDYDENLGQLREDSGHHPAQDSVGGHTSEPKHKEDASSRGESLREGESRDLNPESKMKEGIPREQEYSQSGFKPDTCVASLISLHLTNQPPVFGLGNRPEEPSLFEMDLEFEHDWTFDGGYADSIFNLQ